MHDSLMAWIEPYNSNQHRWIANYLKERGQGDEPIHFADHPRWYEELTLWFKAYSEDPAFRELIRKMRGAWHQKRYREKNGKQLCFQLPTSVQQDLLFLAKARRQPKTQTLRQVISDAARHQRGEQVKTRAAKKINQENVKKLKEKNNQTERELIRFINQLLNELTSEIKARCAFQALNGKTADELVLIHEKQRAYHALLTLQAREIDQRLATVRTMRLPIKTIPERLQSYLTSIKESPDEPVTPKIY